MTDTQLHGIHPEPWPKDPGEALPDVSLPKQWPNDEPPAPEPEPPSRSLTMLRRGPPYPP